MPELPMPVLERIARIAGVSPGTVGRIFAPGEHRQRISAATIDRVRQIAGELGYGDQPPSGESVLVHRPQIGLVTSERLPIALGCYGEVPSHVSCLLHDRGADLVVVINNEGWHQWRQEGREQRLAGAVLLEFMSSEVDQLLRHSRMPLVLLNMPTDAACDSVDIDYSMGVDSAAEHLISLGHRQVLFLTPTISRHSRSLVARDRGMGAALAAAGGHLRVAEGVPTALTALRREPGITAVVTYHEQEVPDLVAGLHDQGLRIPADLSLLSMGGAPAISWVHPAITCLRAPWEIMAREAAALVMDRIGGLSGPPRRCVHGELLQVRASTGRAASSVQHRRAV